MLDFLDSIQVPLQRPRPSGSSTSAAPSDSTLHTAPFNSTLNTAPLNHKPTLSNPRPNPPLQATTSTGGPTPNSNTVGGAFPIPTSTGRSKYPYPPASGQRRGLPSGPPLNPGLARPPVSQSLNSGVARPPVRQQETLITQGVARPPVSDGMQRPPITQGVARPPVTDGMQRPPITQGVARPPVSEGMQRPPITQGVARPPVSERVPNTQGVQSKSQVEEMSVHPENEIKNNSSTDWSWQSIWSSASETTKIGLGAAKAMAEKTANVVGKNEKVKEMYAMARN